MSTDYEKKERTTIIGPTGLNDSVSSISAQAQAIASDRVSLIAPPSLGYTFQDSVTAEDVRVELSSVFAGAALSGIESNPSNTPATPLLRKQLPARIDINSFNYLRSELIMLASAGVLPLRSIDGGAPIVYDQLTTDVTSIEKEERPIRRIKDFVRKGVRDVLDGRYIGTEILGASTLDNIQKTIQSTLDAYQGVVLVPGGDGLSYRNIRAVFNSVDPRQVDIRFEIGPIFTLKFITVVFSIFTQ
jgi:hypothetical protein